MAEDTGVVADAKVVLQMFNAPTTCDPVQVLLALKRITVTQHPGSQSIRECATDIMSQIYKRFWDHNGPERAERVHGVMWRTVDVAGYFERAAADNTTSSSSSQTGAFLDQYRSLCAAIGMPADPVAEKEWRGSLLLLTECMRVARVVPAVQRLYPLLQEAMQSDDKGPARAILQQIDGLVEHLPDTSRSFITDTVCIPAHLVLDVDLPDPASSKAR